MQVPNYTRTKLACYTAYFTMASVASLPALLFVTFHERYGVSWTLLGTLVLVNFCTQLAIDLIFTLFSKKFNVAKVVKVMPFITSSGFIIYAFFPMFFSDAAYLGLLLGTVVFSVSSGLSEVLLSPIIAAIPSENPQRDMSTLHSLYAFGVFFVVIVVTLFLKVVGEENWYYLTLFFAVLPLIPAVLFMTSPIPDISGKQSGLPSQKPEKRALGLTLFVCCIFFGACAEVGMTNWISGYMETVLHIDKALGDVLGMAGFAVLLGLTRISYAKWGKNIGKMLFVGMIGSAVCYLVAGLSPYAIPAFIACILTGIFTAMLWPGTLILMEEKYGGIGVVAYALMSAGGDFGAAIAPQLMGVVADHAGMQASMLVNAIFPILGIVVMIFILAYFKKQEKREDHGFSCANTGEKRD